MNVHLDTAAIENIINSSLNGVTIIAVIMASILAFVVLLGVLVLFGRFIINVFNSLLYLARRRRKS